MDKTFKAMVDELLGEETPAEDFEKAERYARRKLQMAKERQPDATHYDEYYRALLTADVYREMMFSEYTMDLYMARRAVEASEVVEAEAAAAVAIQ